MVFKMSSVKITDFETSFDVNPVATPKGEVIWADVRIDYILASLAPRVIIRVPVPWNADETMEQRRSKALRCARELIDHACRASSIAPAENESQTNSIAEAIEALTPTALQGVTQELGLAKPTIKPQRARS